MSEEPSVRVDRALLISHEVLWHIFRSFVTLQKTDKRAAKALGVSEHSLRQFLTKRRLLSRRVVSVLGFRPVVMYEAVRTKR